MSRNYLKGKRCMVWSFMGNTWMYQALELYGDRLDVVGVFTFEVDISGTISETGTSITRLLPYINQWPHIKWLLEYIFIWGIPKIVFVLYNGYGNPSFFVSFSLVFNK